MHDLTLHISASRFNRTVVSFSYAAILFVSLTSKFAGSGNKDFIN